MPFGMTGLRRDPEPIRPLRFAVDRPASHLARVALVPEGDGVFAQFPAQVNFATVPHGREIHTAALVVADFASDGHELAEQVRQTPRRLHAAGLDGLQFIQPLLAGQPATAFLDALDQAILRNHVAKDPTHQGKGLVGLLNRERARYRLRTQPATGAFQKIAGHTCSPKSGCLFPLFSQML